MRIGRSKAAENDIGAIADGFRRFGDLDQAPEWADGFLTNVEYDELVVPAGQPSRDRIPDRSESQKSDSLRCKIHPRASSGQTCAPLSRSAFGVRTT